MPRHATEEAITIQKRELKVNVSCRNSADMSVTRSIRECYNTKIIPMRSGRGIAGAHVKYKRGDDGSDRVLCVAPQFISGQEYIISATNEDGRDDDESLTPFNFAETQFEGFTASKQEVVVEPVYNEQRKHYTVCFYERGEYHLKTKEDGALVIMNIKYEAAKHGVDPHLYYGRALKVNRKQNRSSKYIQISYCVWNNWKHSSTPEKDQNEFPSYIEPKEQKYWPWKSHRPAKVQDMSKVTSTKSLRNTHLCDGVAKPQSEKSERSIMNALH